jgi:hypothetical protein
MIIFEERTQELVFVLPPNIRGEGVNAISFPINFYWAKDSKEVNQYLKLKDRPYPLIILVRSPEKLKNRLSEEVTRKCRFILAVSEPNTDLLNTDRWESSYKAVLNPLAENFLYALEASTISRLHDDFGLDRVPNYAEADKNNQIDIWDVVVIDCTVSFNNNCLKPLIWE